MGILLKLKFEKAGAVKGESEVEGYKDEIEIDSFSWGTVNPGKLGRHDANETTAQDVNLTKRTDTASPVIFQACATGDPIKECRVAFLKSVGGQKPIEYKTLTISEAFVSSYQIGGSSGVPMDSFSINFKTIKMEFKEQTKGGTPTKPFKGGFDYGAQKPA